MSKPTHVEHIIGEVEFLCGTDDPDSIARRLGFKERDGLYRFLNRNGRHDLVKRIAHYRGALTQVV